MKIYKVIEEITMQENKHTWIRNIFLSKDSATLYLADNYKKFMETSESGEFDTEHVFVKRKYGTNKIFIKECELENKNDFENIYMFDESDICTENDLLIEAMQRQETYKDYLDGVVSGCCTCVIDKALATKIADMMKGE